jgi:protease I
MKLQGKRVFILAEDNYQEMELWYPLLRLREEGAEVVVVGSGSSSSYKSKLGYPVEVDTAADRIKGQDADAVIIPGGYAPDLMRRYPDMVRIVREACEGEKVVGAICHAAWMLVSAGILKGKKATCFFAVKDDLVNAGATYVDEEVVVDGLLITSRKPDDLPAFCREIIHAMTQA